MKGMLAMTIVAGMALSASALAADGKAIYDKSCHVCHAMGVAEAPKAHDVAAWAPRLGQGMPALIAVVKSGKGAMPPGGMCSDCTDEEYKLAIEFMSTQ
ncbi:cbb3-type cytochrome c oxidase subunit III [Sinobacterium caligoides]|uniref:Cbb3-type cytochrome c oxidase subunit III n=1 Tax=Sinobacterium caligoides TaxID=933926 RepID=A0A3N2DK49_9GAMM|nr:c-type cytochrome [Sinobacterium caligoides]ROS00166.1 cbb3-type cytochrome c oxidase subunit III [Sinobacterium caligoides]